MHCELCGKDPYHIALLPIKQPDGKLDTIACMECALSSGHYCKKHDRPHIGFDDNTSACIPCIEEVVLSEGERVAGAFAVRGSNMPNVKEAVREYLDDLDLGMRFATLGDLPLVEMIGRTNNAENVARPIITYAKRLNIPLEEAVIQACESPSKVFLGIEED